MDDKEKNINVNGENPDPEINIEDLETPEIEVSDMEGDSEATEVADMFKKLQETETALAEKNKEYLYLRADFDNYRKRAIKEKSEIIKNASERVLKELLPIVDDFERGLEATKDDSDGQQVREGMELIYNKLIKFLSVNGVKPIESTGNDFNDELHDAIATIPATSEDMKGKVVDTTTKGYTINDKVLRHAKVVVAK